MCPVSTTVPYRALGAGPCSHQPTSRTSSGTVSSPVRLSTGTGTTRAATPSAGIATPVGGDGAAGGTAGPVPAAGLALGAPATGVTWGTWPASSAEGDGEAAQPATTRASALPTSASQAARP